jgi:hypothetical protein
MPNPIKLKRSAVADAVPSSLEFGELALNYNVADGKLFYKNSAGTIVAFESGGGDDARWDYFKPAAPTSVTATAGNAQAVVSWTAPAIVVPPVTDYVVQYSSNSGSTWTTFSDGTSTATSATVTSLTNSTAYTFRVAGVNGIGTGAFSTASAAVTPIAGDTYFSSVSLLLPMDGTGSTFVDASLFGRAVTAAGNATQSTAQSKWGGKSGYCDGDGDYLTSLAPAFGTQDWVIEGWFYPTGSFGGTLVTARSSTGVVGGPTVVIDGSGLLQYFIASADNSTWQIAGTGSGVSLTLNAWQHIAIVRSGSTLRAYKDGVGGTSVSISEGIGTNGNLSLMAGSAAGGQNVSGYVDDFRITVGSDRGYTGSTITVPTAAFPTVGPIGVPTSLAATAGNTQASLTWTAPAYNGGSAITDYSVQYSSNSGSTWTTFSDSVSTATTATVTGLTNDVAYIFRVAAANVFGAGDYTAASSAVTPAVATDPFFSSVALLAPFEGNLTDVSLSPKTISPTHTPAYIAGGEFGEGYIASGGTLNATIPSFGSSPWVAEAWVWVPSSLTAAGSTILRTGDVSADQYDNVSGSGAILGVFNSYTAGASTKIFVIYRDPSLGNERMDSGFAFPRDQWVHVAIAKSASVIRFFVDGISIASRNNYSGEFGGAVGVGDFGGYVDDLRVTIGSDRNYNSDTITVPTAAFPTS